MIEQEKRNRPNIKAYFVWTFESVVEWLNMRDHDSYNYKSRLSYILTAVFLFVASFFGVKIFYANAEKLNSINLFIFKLDGILLLVSLFFMIKYGYRIIKEINNWLKRQRNWLKYLIIVILIALLWQTYVQRDIALNPLFDRYNKIDFSHLNPIIVSLANSNQKTENSASQVWTDLKNIVTIPEKDYPLVEAKILELVNEERSKSGANALTADLNLNSFARIWSKKMISENFFEHSNMNFQYYSTAGENIGETPLHSDVIGCGATYSNDAMARCFVIGWIGSSGHHKNMISTSFYMTGIGIACDSSKCRATQVFSG